MGMFSWYGKINAFDRMPVPFQPLFHTRGNLSNVLLVVRVMCNLDHNEVERRFLANFFHGIDGDVSVNGVFHAGLRLTYIVHAAAHAQALGWTVSKAKGDGVA